MSPQLLRSLAALRHPDAARTAEIFHTDWRAELLAAIVAGDAQMPVGVLGRANRRSRRDRRPRGVRRAPVPVLAGLAACAAAAGGAALLLSAPAAHHARPGVPIIHAAPVSFRYPSHGPDSGYIVATVTDPFAAQSSLDAAFKAAGLDIVVTLEPVSPSLVGTVVDTGEPASGPQMQTLVGGTCVTDGGGVGECPIGLQIPRDFTGQGEIALGRPAKPGERYEATANAFAPGESLHCTSFLGEQVGPALPQLAAAGITPRWHFQFGGSVTPDETPPPADDYIVGGQPVAPGVVWFQTQPTPPSSAEQQFADPEPGLGC